MQNFEISGLYGDAGSNLFRHVANKEELQYMDNDSWKDINGVDLVLMVSGLKLLSNKTIKYRIKPKHVEITYVNGVKNSSKTEFPLPVQTSDAIEDAHYFYLDIPAGVVCEIHYSNNIGMYKTYLENASLFYTEEDAKLFMDSYLKVFKNAVNM